MITIKVLIFSRETAEKWRNCKSSISSEKAAIISFHDPDETDLIDYSQKTDRVFYIGIPDISYDDLEDCGYTYDSFFSESDELAKFIINAYNDGYDFICQCEHGESCSAATAAAITEFYNHNEIEIFASYQYCPNQLIYNKIYDALQREEKVKGI